jgi:tripartite-type tricarboxylate transporter receptor subunit TctC
MHLAIPRRHALLAALPAVAPLRRAGAQPTWPDRPVRLFVGFPPGGPTDFVARVVAPGLAAAWGQPVVVENRAGANATVATDAVAKSPPDGHTLLFGANNHVMNPALYPRLPYDPNRDFAPVGMVATSPNLLWARPNQPFASLADIVAAARARPGQLGYASTGNGGNGHFGGETLKRALGIDITHVPYRGTAPALQDVLAGRVPLFMQTLVGAIGAYRNGQIKPIVAFGPRRAPELPDTPTLAELGHDVADSGVWYGILAPAGTPAPLLRRMASDLERVLRDDGVRERLATQASVPTFAGPDDFAARIRAELPRWAEVARAAGMRAD